MLGLGNSIVLSGLASIISVITSGLKTWLGFTTTMIEDVGFISDVDFALTGTQAENITGTYWTTGDGWSISGSSATLDGTQSGVSSSLVSNVFTVKAGRKYKITINVESTSAAGVRLIADGSYLDYSLEVGESTFYRIASSSTFAVTVLGLSSKIAEVNSVTVKEVAQFVPDKSGNSNVGKLFTGKALSFDGVNDYVDIGNGINPQSGVWTFMATVKSTDTTTSVSGANPIFSRDNYFVVFGIDGGQLSASYHNGGWIKQTFSSDVVSDGSYNRIAYEYDVTNQTCKGYLNGVFLSSITFNPSSVLDFNRIGKAQTFFNGTLSNIQIWQGDLEQSDYTFDYNNPNHLVTDNPNSTVALSNLKGYWALSEGAGSIAYDSSGEGNDGTISGATYDDQQPTIPQLGMMDWSKGSNLYLNSEPTSDESAEQNTTYASYSWNYIGFKNATEFGDNSSLRFRYGSSVTSGLEYTLSAFVIMDDNSEPDITNTASSGDFGLVLGNAVAGGTNTKTNVSGNIWRVSKTKTVTSTSTNNGIIKYTTQSSKGFKVVGWQLEQSSTVGSYIGTAGSSAINATLVQNPNNVGYDVLGNPLKLREYAFNLDGSGYAEVVDDTTLDITTELTLSAWVYQRESGYSSLVNKGNAYTWYVGNASVKSRLFIGSTQFNSNTYPPINQWNYLSVVYDGSTIQFYLNGNADGSTSHTGAIPTNIKPLLIGVSQDFTEGLDEIIDEVVVYNEALTQEEITNNYNAGLSAHSN